MIAKRMAAIPVMAFEDWGKNMKKVFAVLIASVMIMGSSVLGYADESEATILTDVAEAVMDELDSMDADENAGLYYKDGVLHIVPTDESAGKAVLQSAEKKTRSIDNNIVIDAPAKYSTADLHAAKERVYAGGEALGLTAVGINYELNAVNAYAYEWTEEMKQAVYDLAEIENVQFITRTKPTSTKLREEEEPDKEARAEQVAMAGMDMQVESGGKRTINCSAIYNGDEGYVSAGHNLSENSKMEYYQKPLGVVTKSVNSGSCDFSFTKRTSGSVYYPNNEVILKYYDMKEETGNITTSRYPTQGSWLTFAGSATGCRFMEVRETSYKTYNSGANEDLILFQPSYGLIGGDSGGPLMLAKGDRQYAIVGIYKGYESLDDEEPLATKWNNMRDQYGVQLY